ncbi:retrovirus-related pol polyprotein from transposon TNT 1-94 [Tanacetum coccineum]
MKYVVNNANGTPGYCDRLFTVARVLTKESDIYSFGVLLFEMLCGRSVMEHNSSRSQNLVDLVRHHFKEGTLYEMVFEATKKQMAPKSFTTFKNIAYHCIVEERARRPTVNDVLIQLQIALKSQVDFEVWEPQLPRDYKKIIQMAVSRDINLDMSYEDIYTSLHRGILLRNSNVELYTVQRSVQRCVQVRYTLTKWYQEPGYDKQRQKTRIDIGAEGTTKGRKQNRNKSKSCKIGEIKGKVVNMAAGDSDDALVCCVENTVEDHIMDFGASFHATYCKEELERFKLRFDKVHLVDDKTLDITSVGDVILKTSFGTSWTLKDVRYIPSLKRKLI